MSGGYREGPRVHLVYLRGGGMLLTKKAYAGWREIQDAYEDYMTSLGPWTEDELIGFLGVQYGEDEAAWGFTRERIGSFMESAETVLRAG